MLLRDKKQPGLSLLVSYGGAKTFRSAFILRGNYQSRAIGRVGSMTLTEARVQTQADRESATKGIDPRQPKQKELKLFGEVVDEFITTLCKVPPPNVAADRAHGEAPLRRMAEQTDGLDHRYEADALLESIKAEGHPYKARVTHAG